jgi:hypothetical protein
MEGPNLSSPNDMLIILYSYILKFLNVLLGYKRRPIHKCKIQVFTYIRVVSNLHDSFVLERDRIIQNHLAQKCHYFFGFTALNFH